MPDKSETRSKKMDTAIIVALIALVGTIVTVVVGPMVEKWLEKNPATATDTHLTETPLPITDTPSTPATPSGGNAILVLNKDFEDSNTSEFTFETGTWQVRKESNNHLLEATAVDASPVGALATFVPDFTDGVIEFRLKFTTLGSAGLAFRSQPEAEYKLWLNAIDKTVFLAYQGDATNWNFADITGVQSVSFSLERNTWYSLQVEAIGETFTITINDTLVATGQDSRLAHGALKFVLDPSGTTVRIDDLRVWIYDH